MARQVKTKKRVVDHGEVFTNEREVKAMCDLVDVACDRIDSRFLEPACGDGNFMVEILKRKLERVKKLYKNNPYDYERYSILALSSIYGVDILADNAVECRNRIFEIWDKEYKSVCKKTCNASVREAAEYILSQNVLCGNALTMMQVDENQQDTDLPIIFPEWSLLMGTKLKRRDFRLDVLIKANSKPGNQSQTSFIEEDLSEYLSVNPVTGEYMPEPVKVYPAVHYTRIMEVE